MRCEFPLPLMHHFFQPRPCCRKPVARPARARPWQCSTRPVSSLSDGKFLPVRFSFFDAVGSCGDAADLDFLFSDCAVFTVTAWDGFAVAVAAGGAGGGGYSGGGYSDSASSSSYGGGAAPASRVDEMADDIPF